MRFSRQRTSYGLNTLCRSLPDVIISDLIYAPQVGSEFVAIGSLIFRVVQECLTKNPASRGKRHARIRVARGEASVCVEVRNEGKGILPGRLLEIQSGASGVGIAGIRERLRQSKAN